MRAACSSGTRSADRATFQGILLDVTEDEEAKTRLDSSEREQRLALEGALAIPWSETIHPETGYEHYTYIGPQAFEILGYTPEELMDESTHFARMVHPDDRSRVRENATRSEEIGIWEDTYRVLRRDGGIRWLHAFGRRVSPPGADAGSVAWHRGRRDRVSRGARDAVTDPLRVARRRSI